MRGLCQRCEGQISDAATDLRAEVMINCYTLLVTCGSLLWHLLVVDSHFKVN
jgi:hypothetical protein